MLDSLLRFLRGYRVCNRMLSNTDPQLRQDLAKLSDRLEERVPYLLAQSKGQRVIHFGFLDSIFLEQKVKDGTLLHSQLAASAASLYGVDIAPQLLERYRALTGDTNNTCWDITDGCIPQELAQGYDLILFPEVLEHVSNPGVVLENLARLCRSNKARLCLTVPNAFDMYGFMAAMQGTEIIHPDHYYTFTPPHPDQSALPQRFQAAGPILLQLRLQSGTRPDQGRHDRPLRTHGAVSGNDKPNVCR